MRAALATQTPSFLPPVPRASAHALLLGLALLTYVHSLLWKAGLRIDEIADHSICALYIVNLVFVTGAAAGAIIVGTVVGALRIERATPLVRIAELGAISGLTLTTIFITLDLARPERLRQLGRYAHLAWPSAWDVGILAIYLGNAMALGYFASRWELVRDLTRTQSGQRGALLAHLGRNIVGSLATTQGRQMLRERAALLVPAAVLLNSIPAWILGLAKVEPGWQAVPIAATFYMSSVISGLAFVVAAATFSRVARRLEIGEDVIQSLGTVLLVLIPILGYCFLTDVLVIADVGEPTGSHVFHELVVGSAAPLFWFALIGGVIVPFFLLRSPRISAPGRIRLAALLVIPAVLVERWTVVIPSLLGHAHLFSTTGRYAPSASEVSLALGAYATGILVFHLLARRFLRVGPGAPGAPA